jgi:hypothetical protein
MKVKFSFRLEAQKISPADLADSMRRLAVILMKIHPDYARWYLTPTGPKDIWTPLENTNEFNAKIEKENQPDAFMMASITNRPNELEWYKPGRTVLRFQPSEGNIRLEISEPDIFFGHKFFQTMKDILRAFAMEEWLVWASLSCSEKVPDDQPGAKKRDTRTIFLAQQYRTFPHREFLGWMGWIQQLPPKKLLQAFDLPQAAEVHPLPGRSGTMVVSVGEAFDMANPAHIEKMQRVEIRLVELDLLPVIDPEFM